MQQMQMQQIPQMQQAETWKTWKKWKTWESSPGKFAAYGQTSGLMKFQDFIFKKRDL